MGTASALALLGVAACSQRSESPEQRLTSYLANGTVQHLEANDFRQIIVEPFQSLYDSYVAQPVPTVVAPFEIRRHYAGDPALSPSQVRLRWMVPVLYPAYVVNGAVFVEVRGGWRTLTGLDEALIARVRGLDTACAERLVLAGPPGSCTDVGWVIADAALRSDLPRFHHACQLAATACGQR